MAYSQDTIISANASNALGTILEGLLTDAGWTLVEALAPSGTNTPRTSVWLSDGDDNECGYDWYITLMYKQVGTETQFRIIAHGAYDSGTHLATCVAVSDRGEDNMNVYYSAAVTGDMWGAQNVNVATDTSLSTSSPRNGSPIDQPWFSTIVPSSAFGYWASITLDHVALWTTIADGATPQAGPANFFAASLALDPDWVALNTGDFGAGVVLNPVVMYSRQRALSGTLIGTDPAGGRIGQNSKRALNAGSKLPTLVGNWLPAYAWRDSHYWTGGNFAFGTTIPAYDNPRPGDGVLIGQGIDYYAVYGGSIGDTVEIAGETYVLSGAFGLATGDQATTGPYIAVLVEA